MPTEAKEKETPDANDEDAKSRPPSLKRTNDTKRPPFSAKSGGGSPTKPKSVHFQRDPHNPAKIKVGKANVARDLSIFIGIIALFITFSITTVKDVGRDDGSGGDKRSTRKKMTDAYADMIKRIQEEAEAAEKRFKDGGCPILIAESSVPGGGMGLFSSQKFEPGDTVIARSMLLTIPSPIEEEDKLLSQFPSVFPQHALLMKPHPYMANIKSTSAHNDDSFISLTASRFIEPGDELFIDYNRLPKHFHFDASTPTEESYQIADTIVADLMESSRPKTMAPKTKTSGKTKRKKNDLKKKKNDLKKKKNDPTTTKEPIREQPKSRKYNRKKQFPNPKEKGGEEMKDSLELVKIALSRVDAKVASLIPTSYARLNKTSTFGSAYESLTNRTLVWLSKNGKCIDDSNFLQVRSRATDGTEKGFFAARFISQGEVILPIPLYAHNNETKKISTHSLCFYHPSSSLSLCSLTFGSLVKHQAAKDMLGTTATATCIGSKEEQGYKEDCQSSPNSKYQWSSWNPWNDKLRNTDPKEIIKMHATSLSLDLVATRDIGEGEEISMDYGMGWETAPKVHVSTDDGDDSSNTLHQMVKLHDELLPSAWRTR